MKPSNLIIYLVVLSLTSGAVTLRAAEESSPVTTAKKLPPAASKQGVTFEQDIKPLFEASCVKCHSGQKAKARLHLDTLDGVLAGSEDGKVLVVGKSAESSLVKAIARINPKTMMPPPPRKPRPGTEAQAPAKPQGPPPKPLTPEEVGLVRAWIDQGAK